MIDWIKVLELFLGFSLVGWVCLLYGVLRKETLHLLVELGCQRLVMTQNQGRAIAVGNDICHRKRLSRTCDTQQHLSRRTGTQSVHQRCDRLRLVSGWFICTLQFEHFGDKGTTKNSNVQAHVPLFLKFRRSHSRAVGFLHIEAPKKEPRLRLLIGFERITLCGAPGYELSFRYAHAGSTVSHDVLYRTYSP